MKKFKYWLYDKIGDYYFAKWVRTKKALYYDKSGYWFSKIN